MQWELFSRYSRPLLRHHLDSKPLTICASEYYRETDPFGKEAANKTVLGETPGGLGGNYESMAYDNRAKFKPRFFITNGR